MTIQHPLHLDPFYSNRQIDLKVTLINIAGKFVSLVKKRLHITSLKTGIIKSLNKDLGKMYLMVKGLSCYVAEELTAEKAKEEYKSAESSLNKFKHLYSLLEAVNFIGSRETEELCNRILIELYAIEGKLRNLAFQDVTTTGEDEELKKISSVISINSARPLHADAI
jgi:hypothetical protein